MPGLYGQDFAEGDAGMKIGPGTRVGPLLDRYPFLVEVLSEHAPEFRRLRNPLMRKTFARVATLASAASLAKTDLGKLLEAVARAIREKTSEAVEVKGGQPAITQERMDILKGIIRDLHAGVPAEELTARFSQAVGDFSPTEIAEMEQQLVAEGLPVQEVKRLCDVHAGLFRTSLDEQEPVEVPPGHPVHTMRLENQAAAIVVKGIRKTLEEVGKPPSRANLDSLRSRLEEDLERLGQLDNHYMRKEYQIFPILERYGVDAPPQVMWAVHDDIRQRLKAVREYLRKGDASAFVEGAGELLQMVEEMFFKEEKILIPMCMDVFTEADWASVKEGEGEFGFTLITPAQGWKPAPGAGAAPPAREPMPGESEDLLALHTGRLTLEEINLVFRYMPVDVTFVDENDEVRFYSEGERVFPRSPGVIGRKVQNCHPPDSVHVVQRILDEFRDGSKDVAEFWLQMKGRFVHIRYYAVRDGQGRYRGTLEVSQDVTGIRALEGERRLLDW
jgi:DUF438 domain-containing protein